jgi:hypothetical protein
MTQEQLTKAIKEIQRTEQYVKTLAHIITFFGPILLGLMGFIGYSFDQRLSSIETILMSRPSISASNQSSQGILASK